jgi:DNA-binding FadR family transcriptional regulator
LRRTERQLDELENISAQKGGLRSTPGALDCAHGYRLLNRCFHHAIHGMAHSRIMGDTSRRMWDLSDFLINTTGVPQPLSSALDERHADHEAIRAALHDQDQAAARAEMERHIVGTVAVIHAETRSQLDAATSTTP